jgi:hypothetical protein
MLVFKQILTFLEHAVPLGLISCQYLLPGGSIGPRYDLQLLSSEKSQN